MEKERPAVRAGKLLLLILLLGALGAALWYALTHAAAAASPASAVRLNEVMTSNKGSVPDGLGNYPDYVELYNADDKAADISGYGLSDDLLSGAKYVIPAGTSLEPGEFLVIFCAGEAISDLHAPFKLSATDDLILYDTTGAVLESMGLRAVGAGLSLAFANDAWGEMEPSPGYPNTPEGVSAYKAALQATEDVGLYINEFMASNKTTLRDQYGDYPDWIELYNATDADMDLAGYGISDSASQPMKYVLPAGTVIPAKGFLLLYCSGNETTENEVHIPFGLRAYEEDVVLASPAGKILDSYAYARMESDESIARSADGAGEFAPCSRPTPGYPNTDEGYARYLENSKLALGDVYISEIMGNNVAALSYNDGFPDWVELYNRGSAEADLTGYALSNNANNPAKWVFPSVTLAPGESLLLYATGTGKSGDAEAQKKNLELNFKISAAGETVFLFDPQGTLVDRLSAGSFLPDVSCGRTAEETVVYYTAATPGAPNAGTAYLGITGTPRFSLTPGVYDTAQTLELSAGEGEGIYYTLDCTTPTAQNGLRYEGPIALSKNTVVRATAVRTDYLNGGAASGTWLFRTDGANHALEIACLVTDPDNLWDAKTGIYAFGENFDAETTSMEDMLVSANFYQGKKSEADQANWTRKANFAICGADGTQVFSQDVDIRIAGAFGRSRAQKGFNIIANEAYGSNRMAYPFFENRPYTEYKSVVLRAGAQDQNYSKIRDELATGLLEDTDAHILVQAYRPYVLYLNGEYWGVYFLKEKRSRFFVAQHEGVEDAMNLDLVKSATRVSHGTAADWNALMEYVNAHDLTQADAYDYVASQVDLESFADYMIAEIYSGNTDTWNVQYYKLPGGKWRWIYYDFCWAFGSDPAADTLSYRRQSNKPLSDLFNKLLENRQWRAAFANRFAYMLENVYNAQRVNAQIDALYAAVQPEIERERAKFNAETFMGVRQLEECRDKGFERQIRRVRDFADGRAAALMSVLQKELGYTGS